MGVEEPLTLQPIFPNIPTQLGYYGQPQAWPEAYLAGGSSMYGIPSPTLPYAPIKPSTVGPSRSTKARRLSQSNPYSTLERSRTTRAPPTNHALVPQWKPAPPASAVPSVYRSISFVKLGFSETGMNVGYVLDLGRSAIDIEEADQTPFVDRKLREQKIDVVICWPGQGDQYKKRINIRPGGNNITAENLLRELAQLVVSFELEVSKSNITTNLPQWAICSGKPRDHQCDRVHLRSLFITKLVHIGGATWQVELWAPSQRRKRAL